MSVTRGVLSSASGLRRLQSHDLTEMVQISTFDGALQRWCVKLASGLFGVEQLVHDCALERNRRGNCTQPTQPRAPALVLLPRAVR